MRGVLMAVALGLAVWSGGEPAEAKRRPRRCCIMVPDDGGGERPYCFVVNARPARYARRVCRAVGGRPERAVR
jgi:hypothetical protein